MQLCLQLRYRCLYVYIYTCYMYNVIMKKSAEVASGVILMLKQFTSKCK